MSGRPGAVAACKQQTGWSCDSLGNEGQEDALEKVGCWVS